jgi:putative ABC transport system permease protein
VNSVLYLAWRYLVFHRVKTLILVLSLAAVLAMPVSLLLLAGQGERHLAARANASPLLIGAKGSPLEIVLNSLYFRSKVPELMRFEEVEAIRESGLARPIPIYARFKCQEDPIVATTLDYFEFRDLKVLQGKQMTRLGDCVLGSEVARRRGLKPGDNLLSSPERAFDVAGVQPLRMRITGVLDFTDGPDDHAVFVDIKTAWIIEGLGHGHTDLSTPEGGHVTAKVPVPQYTEVTDRNLESFHFHGEMSQFPITAVLAIPPDEKSGTRLLGRYQAEGQRYQGIEPAKVMQELLGTVVTLKTFALAASAIVGVITVALIALIQMLSLRLRKREIETLTQIGGSRGRIFGVLAAEALIVLLMGALLAAAISALIASRGTSIVRWWLG